jgi:hypothetical protein
MCCQSRDVTNMDASLVDAKRKDSLCNQYICDGHNTYTVGNLKTRCIQGSNVRICNPFGSKIMCCPSRDVATIDELVDAKRKDSLCNQYICDGQNTYIFGNVKTRCI